MVSVMMIMLISVGFSVCVIVMLIGVLSVSVL